LTGAPADLRLVVTAAEADPTAAEVRRLTLAAPDGGPLPSFRPGSHLGLRWRQGGRDRVNYYSLTGEASSPAAYHLSVLRAPGGHGGSRWAHGLRPGHEVTAVAPHGGFAPAARARRHLLVAGGIGVTPLLSHARWHARHGADFALYYAWRPGRAPHLDDLRNLCGERLQAYAARESLWADLGPALARQPPGTHLYVCGPLPMIGAVTAAARALHWPGSRVHVESFGVAEDGPRAPFRVVLSRSGRSVHVSPEHTLLEALEQAGVPAGSMCRQGVCGECRLPVASGGIDHRDQFLSPQEKAEGHAAVTGIEAPRGHHHPFASGSPGRYTQASLRPSATTSPSPAGKTPLLSGRIPFILPGRRT
jgi:ferredoxin-NADP reductase